MTAPHYADDTITVHHGNSLDVLRTLPDNSIDAVVTDPPYGLAELPTKVTVAALTAWLTGDREHVPDGRGFMGNGWDKFVPPPALWDECYRVLKPGGHVLAFAGSRTQDLMGLSIRLAGFEVRDALAWLYGSGFPKSLDVAKAIDKLDAAEVRLERAFRFTEWMRGTGITARQIDEATGTRMGNHYTTHPTQPSIATADLFDQLRPLLPTPPAWVEDLVAERTVESENYKARRVIGEHAGEAPGLGGERFTVTDHHITAAHTPEAATWEGWGTALKPAYEPILMGRRPLDGTVAGNVLAHGTGALNIDACRIGDGAGVATFDRAERLGHEVYQGSFGTTTGPRRPSGQGRWPANVVLDESQATTLDEQSGEQRARGNVTPTGGGGGMYGHPETTVDHGAGDSGGASRFFYTAKATADERPRIAGVAHPTVKPLTLMRWLVRLITPPGGTVLEPFAGSGTTVEACLLEGLTCIAVEAHAPYLPLIVQRIDRRRDPVAAIRAAAADVADLGLFAELL